MLVLFCSTSTLVYLVVLFGSFGGICLLIVVRIVMRHRRVRKFVMSVKQRLHTLQERGEEIPESRGRDCEPTTPPSVSLCQVYSLVRSAEKALAQERIEEAERLLIAALAVNPSACDVQGRLAKLYLTTGREGKAEAMYHELLQGRTDASSYANLGLACYKQGKYLEACASYEEALKLDPKNPERMAAFGKACVAAQRFLDAALWLERASTQPSRSTELLRLLAECFQQLGERQKSEETYRRINRLEPYDEEVKAKILELARA